MLAALTLSFGRNVALVGGLVLPALETWRRWHQLTDPRIWPFWLDDWLIGALLLYGVWRTRDGTTGGRPVLAAAWGFACAMGYASFFSELADDASDPSGLARADVLYFKGAMLLTATLALVATLRVRPWQERLPVLRGARIFLREVEPADAGALLAMLSSTAVHHIPPPVDLAGMTVFIRTVIQRRAEGCGAGFVAVRHGETTPVGFVQLYKRPVAGPGWGWGFVFARDAWGQGLFQEAARLVVPLALDEIRVRELEAWVVETNDRANRAMKRLGANATLMRATRVPDGRSGDFIRWTIGTDGSKGRRQNAKGRSEEPV